MKPTKSSQNIYKVLTPAYRFFKLFGLAPFSIYGPLETRKVQTNFFDKIYTLFALAIHFVSVFLLRVFVKMFGSVGQTKFLSICWETGFNLMIFGVIICTIYNYWRRENIVKLLELLERSDEMVRRNFRYSICR
jgi:uncharacterized membrane protein (DUF485 family)